MRRRTRTKAVVALVTAVLLLGLSAVVLVDTTRREEAPGLAAQFRAADTSYQQATEQFVSETQALQDADLRTALRLYGMALDAARDAQAALSELPVVEETTRPTDRMLRALEVQVLALQDAMTAARNRDQQGTEQASQQFQTAVLAYLAARQAMDEALAACGDRCR